MSSILDRAAEASCDSICPSKRTKFNIIWSCLSTILICSWTSVHPNIPARKKWSAGANRLRRLIWKITAPELTNRLKLMIWMIVAPELVLAWAVRQLFSAWEIRDKFNKGSLSHAEDWKKWTMVHGHFFDMGGFTVVDPSCENDNPKNGSQDGNVLTLNSYGLYLRNPEIFPLPTLTKDDIKDRSKADALAKALAFLQTLWFLIQCAARHHQGLTLTELELVTVALASLNFFTYVIWWYKPLDVREPVRIYFPRNPTPITSVAPPPVASTTLPHTNTPGSPSTNQRQIQATKDAPKLSVKYVFSEAWKLLKESFSALGGPCPYFKEILVYLFFILPLNVCYIISFPFYILFPMGVVVLLRTIQTKQVDDVDHLRIAARMLAVLQRWRHRMSLSISDLFTEWYKASFRDLGRTFYFAWFLFFPVMFLLLVLSITFLCLFSLLLFFLSFVFDSAFDIVTTREVSHGVSRVPPFYALQTMSDRFSRMLVFALFGIFFGGIHIFGWNLIDQTASERILWRATSVAITTIPFVVASIDYLLENVLPNGGLGKWVRDGLDLLMTLLLVAYVLARLSLITQALALLRDQPLKALLVVDWAKYIPHIFS